MKVWYRSHKEHVRKNAKAWEAANREKHLARHREKQHRRRAAIYGGGDGLGLKEWRDIVASFGGACAYCGATDKKLTQEHMTPISRGGKHDADNVVPACGNCNSQKHTKLPIVFLWERAEAA